MIALAVALSSTAQAASDAARPDDVELAIERGRAALLEARPADAMDELDGARHVDWFAARLYLRACDHAGLLPLCEADPAAATGFAEVVAAWHRADARDAVLDAPACAEPEPELAELCAIATGWTRYGAGDLAGAASAVAGLEGTRLHPNGWRLRLRVARKAGDDRELARLGLELIRTRPEHPQVLSELFIGGFDGRRTRRARRAAVRHASTLAPEDPVSRWRLLRLAMSADLDGLADRLADALIDAETPRPATQKPYGDAMEKALGAVLARTEAPRARGPTAPDRLAVAADLSRRLVRADRAGEAAEMWTEVRQTGDSSEAAAAHARVLLGLERVGEAEEAALTALDLAAGPAWDDVGRLDGSRWASELAESFAVLAEVREGQGRDGRAAAALAATLLPSERNDRIAARLGTPEGDLAHDGPAARAARLVLAESRADWEGQHAWLVGRDPRAAEVARLHVEALAGADTPRHRAVRDAFQSRTEIVDDRPLGVGDAFPLDLLGLEAGRPAVVSAWASWCGPCRTELPEVDALVAELRADGRGLQAVALSVDKQEAVYRRSLARFGFEALRAVRSPEAGADLDTGALPTLWLIDADGVVVGIRVGYSEDALLAIRALVGADSGRTP